MRPARLAAALGLMALLAVGAGAAALAWLLSPPGASGEPIAVELPDGASLGTIARRLEEAGAVRNARAFEALARWHGVADRLRAGEYDLAPTLSAGEVLDRIRRGAVRTYRVSVPEGLTAAEIADRLAAQGLADREAFLAVVRSPEAARELGVEGDGLEGYLFPETYQIARGLSPRAIAGTMVAQFLGVWEPLAARAAERGLGMRQAVILASIVEKETGAPEERPLIAAVFLNRLRRGMRLETDPTVIYGIADFDGNLRRAHLEDDSNPYNTYRIPGLPPGPIANPGEAALRAVVEPADAKYLYFVSRNDGTHVFSRTFREHAAAVERYQKRRRRGGSP